MLKEKTIAATTRVTLSTEEGMYYLCRKVTEISGCQALSTRQIASNMFEVELYLEDITDLWLLGLAVGRELHETE